VRRTIEAAQAEAISAPQISNSLGSSTAAQPPSELKLKPAEQSLLLRLDSALIADVASIGSPIWQTEEFGRKALFHPEFEGQLFYPDWRAFHRLVASGLVRVATEKDEQGVEGIAVRLTALGSAYASDLLDEVVQLKDQRVTVPDRGPGNNTVWVIEGQDKKAHDLVYGLLHAAGLRPLEFDQAASLTGKPSPTIMEILEAAFKEGQAFLALFTPDEQVSLRPELRKKTPEVISNTGVDWTEPTADEKPEYQPRPNAILEAGMAFALHPDRTVVLEMGAIRPISDIAGIHTVRWKQDDVSTRRKLLEKLRLAGCMPDTSGSHWMEVGKEKQSG
jgi:predicted nucleotide-binding protein